MIDCHAHVFPDFGYQAGRITPKLKDDTARFVRQSATAFDGALSVLHNRLQGIKSPVSIDRLDKVNRRIPQEVGQVVEGAFSLFSMPAFIAGGSLERLLSSMDRHGLEKTIVIAASPLSPNKWILGECMEKAGERLVPVAALPNPGNNAEEEDWLKAWEDLAESGARGFKIHLNMDGLSPDHIAYRTLFETAGSRNLFVIIHTGMFNVPIYRVRRGVDPYLFETYLKDYPDVRVCFAHMNRAEPERVWSIMKDYPQVYTDTSWQSTANLKKAFSEVGYERILLGSDWPLMHGDLQGDSLRVLCRAAGRVGSERISSTNALEFMG